MAISDTDMMDYFVASGIHLDQNNLDWYLGEDRASFSLTGAIRTGKVISRSLTSYPFYIRKIPKFFPKIKRRGLPIRDMPRHKGDKAIVYGP